MTDLYANALFSDMVLRASNKEWKQIMSVTEIDNVIAKLDEAIALIVNNREELGVKEAVNLPCGPKLSETEVDAVRLLNRSVQTLEEYGWIQGQSGNCDMGFCVGRSIDREYYLFRGENDKNKYFNAMALILKVAKTMGYFDFAINRVAWNDQIGQTAENVIGTLISIARYIEHGRAGHLV